MQLRRFLGVGLVGAIGLATACGSTLTDVCDLPGNCDVPDAGADRTTTDGPAAPESSVDDSAMTSDSVPPGCDPNADPRDSPECVSNQVGLFVDGTNGIDTNAGTKDAPLKTIQAAVMKAASAPQRRVYVCAGTYPEAVTLTSAVSLYGGWACANWSYTGAPAKVAPIAGAALRVDGVAGALTVEDLELDGPVGTPVARASVAAFVNASPSLTLKRVALRAGAGVVGGAGAAGSTGVPVSGDLNGIAAAGNLGGQEKACACTTGGTSSGGKGGAGGVPTDGDTGKVAQATSTPATATGAGGTVAECTATGTSGRPGSLAPASTNGAGGGAATLDAMGWHGGDGTAGVSGVPGQGGGGGGGQTTGGGGGGACGGCGGMGGGLGTAGGASIALAAVGSPVTLIACTLTAAGGGNGGNGAGGASGAAGGINGNGANGGCNGGKGGAGGAGGAGGGGTGGHSIGVLYVGTAPTLDGASTVTTSAAGAAGTGGAPGVNGGKAGVKADTKDVSTL